MVRFAASPSTRGRPPSRQEATEDDGGHLPAPRACGTVWLCPENCGPPPGRQGQGASSGCWGPFLRRTSLCSWQHTCSPGPPGGGEQTHRQAARKATGNGGSFRPDTPSPSTLSCLSPPLSVLLDTLHPCISLKHLPDLRLHGLARLRKSAGGSLGSAHSFQQGRGSERRSTSGRLCQPQSFSTFQPANSHQVSKVP